MMSGRHRRTPDEWPVFIDMIVIYRKAESLGLMPPGGLTTSGSGKGQAGLGPSTRDPGFSGAPAAANSGGSHEAGMALGVLEAGKGLRVGPWHLTLRLFI